MENNALGSAQFAVPRLLLALPWAALFVEGCSSAEIESEYGIESNDGDQTEVVANPNGESQLDAINLLPYMLV